MVNFPESDLDIIAAFIEHLKQHGFAGLVGRNKASHEVPKDDPDWREKVAYAQQHNLWHYHIGIPEYQITASGDNVSEYILHYIKGDGWIKIVDFNRHPPFRLPAVDCLV
ncbi:MAG: hypothetical protein CR974_00730 [Gammaproteobacteria bacterium]|nr:MAG: hypothetical protein CR974_00730 [Gammaproteobacteria bacterium]